MTKREADSDTSPMDGCQTTARQIGRGPVVGLLAIGPYRRVAGQHGTPLNFTRLDSRPSVASLAIGDQRESDRNCGGHGGKKRECAKRLGFCPECRRLVSAKELPTLSPNNSTFVCPSADCGRPPSAAKGCSQNGTQSSAEPWFPSLAVCLPAIKPPVPYSPTQPQGPRPMSPAQSERQETGKAYWFPAKRDGNCYGHNRSVAPSPLGRWWRLQSSFSGARVVSCCRL